MGESSRCMTGKSLGWTRRGGWIWIAWVWVMNAGWALGESVAASRLFQFPPEISGRGIRGRNMGGRSVALMENHNKVGPRTVGGRS